MNRVNGVSGCIDKQVHHDGPISGVVPHAKENVPTPTFIEHKDFLIVDVVDKETHPPTDVRKVFLLWLFLKNDHAKKELF